jgi:hypothetical protein
VERLSKLGLGRRASESRRGPEAYSRPTFGTDATELGALQALLDRSTRTATPTIVDSVAYPARQMSAVEFWRSVRLVGGLGETRPGGLQAHFPSTAKMM